MYFELCPITLFLFLSNLSYEKSWLYFFFDLKQIRGKWITCFRKRNGFVHLPIRLLITPLLHMGVASALYQPAQRWSYYTYFLENPEVFVVPKVMTSTSRNTVVGTTSSVIIRRITSCWLVETSVTKKFLTFTCLITLAGLLEAKPGDDHL